VVSLLPGDYIFRKWSKKRRKSESEREPLFRTGWLLPLLADPLHPILG